jgi:hypothetical protein
MKYLLILAFLIGCTKSIDITEPIKEPIEEPLTKRVVIIGQKYHDNDFTLRGGDSTMQFTVLYNSSYKIYLSKGYWSCQFTYGLSEGNDKWSATFPEKYYTDFPDTLDVQKLLDE